MDQYDGITIGTLATETWLENRGIIANSKSIGELYDVKLRTDLQFDSQDVLNEPGDDVNTKVYEMVEKTENGLIKVIGQDGSVQPVSNGYGLGVKQHEDVMLTYGYSRFTRTEDTITGNNFKILRLDTNDVQQHHAESRKLSTRNESIKVYVYDVTGQENLFPASPTQMVIFNQQNPTQETPGVDVVAELNEYPVQATNPFSALTPIDEVPLWIASQNPANTRPSDFPSVKGRHYKPNSTYALVIENLGTSSTEVYYQYDWHEY